MTEFCWKNVGCLVAGVALLLPLPKVAVAQAAAGPQFEVASLRLSAPDSGYRTNFGLDSADDTGRLKGVFRANTSLKAYIEFAYRLPEFQDQEEALLQGFPAWARSNLLAVEARAEGNPTKVEVRQMMQNLLMERLQLKTHYETRVLPAYAVVLADPGKPGPGLQVHDKPCEERSTPQLKDTPREKSNFCGDSGWMENELFHVQMQDTTMAHFVEVLTGLGALQGDTEFKALVDGTGLEGHYDIALAFRLHASARVDAGPDAGGLTAVEAMKKQLGLKLVKRNAPIRLLVVDHLEKPAEN